MVNQIPQYTAMKLLAAILRAVGIVAIIAIVVILLIGAIGRGAEGRAVAGSIVFTPVFLVYGIMILAMASFLEAVRDIAINSWHTRELLERGSAQADRVS